MAVKKYINRKFKKSEIFCFNAGINTSIINRIKKEASKITGGEFAEWENVHGNFYGTLKSKLNNSIKNEQTVLLELDVNGTTSVQKLYPNHSYSIFIIPPSINDLRSRLKSRGSETNETIEKRLKRFDKEMRHKDQFDTLLINDNIEVAIKDFITKVNNITKGVY